MFDTLSLLPSDPILGLLQAFRADPSSAKVDLGVGVYKDEQGRTPVLESVRAAEAALLQEQDSKSYLGPGGNELFNAAIAALVLGPEHAALREGRVRTLQAPGGCGALRIGAELLVAANRNTKVHVSDPTWANHVPLLGGAGLRLEVYPYYDGSTGAVRFDSMMERLSSLPAGEVVLVHAACHNPTGADLSAEQWQALAVLFAQRGLIPFIDIAYQGFGDGIAEDAFGARIIAQSVSEAVIAVSCSKNFGLYRERVGALIVIGERGERAEAAASHLRKIARGLYSMPPDHGAAIVARIMGDAQLEPLWRKELTDMRQRVNELRSALSAALARSCPQRDFSAVGRQRGMFSMLALPPGAVDRLRQQHHIYMTGEGRINIAGLQQSNIDYVAGSISQVLAGK